MLGTGDGDGAGEGVGAGGGDGGGISDLVETLTVELWLEELPLLS